MKTYTEKELTLLDKISDTIAKMDDAVQNIDDSDSKVGAFFAQQKALHEVRGYTREVKALNRTLSEEAEINAELIGDDEDSEDDAIYAIDKTLDKLENTLRKLDETDSRIKGWFEQKKAIHEIKKILHNVGKFAAYEEDELERI